MTKTDLLTAFLNYFRLSHLKYLLEFLLLVLSYSLGFSLKFLLQWFSIGKAVGPTITLGIQTITQILIFISALECEPVKYSILSNAVFSPLLIFDLSVETGL